MLKRSSEGYLDIDSIKICALQLFVFISPSEAVLYIAAGQLLILPDDRILILTSQKLYVGYGYQQYQLLQTRTFQATTRIADYSVKSISIRLQKFRCIGGFSMAYLNDLRLEIPYVKDILQDSISRIWRMASHNAISTSVTVRDPNGVEVLHFTSRKGCLLRIPN